MVTPNPTSAVNPSQDSIDLLATWPDDGPIAMLNLLAFNGDDGRAAYGRYGAVASKTVAARGGSAIFIGAVTDPTSNWDSVVLVYYPRRAAYLDMQRDQAYLDVIPERTAGLRARLLYPFALPEGDVAPTLTAADTEVFEIELVHSPNPAHVLEPTTPDHVVLDLPAGGPGLVTDQPWDHLRVALYPSAESATASQRATTSTNPDGNTVLRLVIQPAASL